MNATAINSDVTLSIKEICDLARSHVEADVVREIGAQTRLSAIDKEALDMARAWRRAYHVCNLQDREPGWDWTQEYYSRGQRSKGVSLAIWSGDALCGLMIGKVSDGKCYATIHFLESDPSGNPLKGNVVDIATRYIEAIGALVGCEEVRISRPIPDLIEYYKQFGYVIEQRKSGIVMSLGKKMVIEDELPDQPQP